MRPPAALLERLNTTRLRPSAAQPSVGIGERRSQRKGPGMEFVDHRPYQPGDDTRHLDLHLYARTGEFMMREYSLNQQLPVSIVLDLSPSMTIGRGEKSARARELAQLLGFTALVGGDRVQVIVPEGEQFRVSDRWHGANRAEPMFDWIFRASTSGAQEIPKILSRLPEHLPPRGMVIVISDWWDAGLEPALDNLAAHGQELLGIQVLSPTEIDPAAMTSGTVTLEDAETGDEIELPVDAALMSRYRQLFEARRARIEAQFNRRQWHFITVSTDDDLNQLFTRTLRAQGVLS